MEERGAEPRVPNNGEDKENQETNNNEARLPHLKYETFKHTGLGLETYMDGVQHPLELRRILIGDLSQEMSVSYRPSEEETFQRLVHPKHRISSVEKSSIEILCSTTGQPVSFPPAANLPKPPKLIKAGILGDESAFPGGLWESQPQAISPPESVHEEEEDARQIVSTRRPGRPPGQQGTFDPDSGTIRYICRLNCGASLASAKGRRKHEKKHCPNVPKEHPGMYYSDSNIVGHSLFGGRVPVKKQEWFECRLCGKVLKTYEGRRLHEKLQHLPHKKNPAINKNIKITKVESLGHPEIEDSMDIGPGYEQDEEAGVEEPVVDLEEEDDDGDEIEEDLDNE